jgi:oxygen-independent coproporphyrinogen-3 oxidase
MPGMLSSMPEAAGVSAAPVPRYTSYPTANHFAARIGPETHAAWLAALPAGSALSLYVHVPFCRALCFYCGCTTQAVRRHAPVAAYLDSLAAEAGRVARHLPADHVVRHVHLGGGSPDILTPAEIRALGAMLTARLRIAPDAGIAAEIDPRGFDAETAAAFAAIGLTRASIGVQDFDPVVQRAIGRVQGVEETARAVALLRAHGVRSVNIDLVYGLPHQTEAGVARTLEAVLALAPDRVAVFGYAHLPSRLARQRLIPAAALPDGAARLAQARRLAAMLVGAGYVARGIDHFARPEDALATHRLHRNFQGYTTDDVPTLIGLGASAISRLPQGYAQNAALAREYADMVAAGGLATVRGHALGRDDRVRGAAIERVMCDLAFSAGELRARFGIAAEEVVAIARRIMAESPEGLLLATPDGFRLTEAARPFARLVASRFDAYLTPDAAARRHAPAV